MVAVAANLRPAAAAVGPVVDQIRASLGLSSTAASALLALPLVCFGAAALLAPPLAARLGHSRSIGVALVLLAAGLLLRVTGGVAELFAGTLLAGAAIAIVNVMLPVVVKGRFAGRTGYATAVYMASLTGVAALAAALTVPIEHALGGGWQTALGVWALPAGLALIAWAPQLRDPAPSRSDTGAPPANRPAVPARALLRDPVARQLVVFFGLQAASFYAILSWLPTIFQADGLSATTAGFLLGVSMFMGLPAALMVPGLATRASDQRFFPVGLCALTAIGFVGLIVAPTSVPLLWAALIGLGQGAAFPLAMTMIVLRSGAVAVTTALSTLVQGSGYLIAACGPLLVGAIHDLTGSWSIALGVLACLLIPQALSGAVAGRPVRVGEPR
jgi:CP family cyanate transporter-like MFS transporter